MNAVVHFELPFEDGDRISKFYEAVFNWKIVKLGPEAGNYILVTTAEKDAIPGQPAGSINGGLFKKDPNWVMQHPSIVIGVENVEEHMLKIKNHGGVVLIEPHAIPGTGLYVAFRDTEGNVLSILQPEMK